MEEISLHGVDRNAFRPFDAIEFQDGTTGIVGSPSHNPDGSLRILVNERRSIGIIEQMTGYQTLYNVSMNQLSNIQLGGGIIHNTTISEMPFHYYPENYDEEDQIIK